ncbi:MAG TPA: LysM peptidoglycan-binding domain-containing protein, partial [Aggregatilineaceae bacterium]|nr:LysM peptidoglycan-binding domain-containing protein [Aggregatilineaceae bacterium]
ADRSILKAVLREGGVTIPMPLYRSGAARSAFFFILVLALAGCFRSAGDTVEPTTVNLTSIAPTNAPTPTLAPFVTPISTGGFVTEIPSNPTPEPPTLVLPTIEPASATPADNVAAAQPGEATPVAPSPAPPDGAGAPTVAPAVLPPTPTALATEGPCLHTVQPGEWLYSIARKFNVPYADLIAANPQYAANPDSLKLGDVVRIPKCNAAGMPNPPPPANAAGGAAPTVVSAGNGVAPTPIPLTDRLYTVAEGDTLGAIARKFNTTVQALKDANGLTSDLLHVGQILKIPKPES